MPPLSIEHRLASLEREVATLKAQRMSGAGSKDWRRTVGMFTDNPEMQELFAEAMKLRAADREKAHGRQRKKQAAKS